jgi:ribosomal protein S27E
MDTILKCWHCGNTDPAKFKANAGYPTFRPKCRVCGAIIWKKGEVENVSNRTRPLL